MGARGELVPSPGAPALSDPPAAWLLGWVRTDVPGYREMEIGSTLYVVPSGTYRFDAFVDAITVFNGDIVWNEALPAGVAGIGANAEVYPDRLGWLIGANVEAGGTPLYTDALVIPPGGIPLIGYTWTRVTIDQDRRQIVDRYKRNQGYVWGGALIIQTELTMHRWSFEALRAGWCLRGNVTVGGSSKLNDAFDGTDPQGAITGYVLGIEAEPGWQDQRQTVGKVTMYLATED